MRTAVDTDGLPQPGDVVLLKSSETHWLVRSHNRDGWGLIQVVSARRLGRYRSRYPGPSFPLPDWEETNLPGPCSVVSSTKDLPAAEADDFLDVVGMVSPRVLAQAQRLVR